jgi:hypothetical protein
MSLLASHLTDNLRHPVGFVSWDKDHSCHVPQADARFGSKTTNHLTLKSTFVRCCPKADKRGRSLIVR